MYLVIHTSTVFRELDEAVGDLLESSPVLFN